MPDLSALDNVLLGAHSRMKGGLTQAILRLPSIVRAERTMRGRASELLERLGLPAAGIRPAGSLPHGDRRRVEVARALIGEPRLLLLDEPAAGLGADEAADLLSDVEAFAAEIGMTCVLVEHDVGLVMRVSRHVVVLDAGQLLVAGSPSDVAADEQVIAAYLGDDWSEVTV